MLAERGLLRVLTEGGPAVLGMFIEQDLLDELCLTVAPIIVGGKSAPHRHRARRQVHTSCGCAHALTDDDGYLYSRYVAGAQLSRMTPVSTVVGMRRRSCPRHAVLPSGRRVHVLAGCSPGLAANPRFATDSGAGPQGAPQTTKPPDGPPGIEAPKNDLSWRDCTSRVFGDAALDPIPGVTLDCASYDADLDPINGATGTVSIGVVRARSAQTPADAGPLVMTTGSDLPSSVQLPVWLSRAGADVLAKSTRSSRWTAAASACRVRWTAATCSTARRCSSRPSSSPVTTRSPTSARSP